MAVLFLEHGEVRQEIERAKKVLAEMKLEGLSRDEVLTNELRLQEVINGVSRVIEEHASREEVVLNMLKRALEHQTKGKSA